MTDATPAPDERQIKIAIEQVMSDIATAIYGENRQWEISFHRQGVPEIGLAIYWAEAQQIGGDFCVSADVPIRAKDGHFLRDRIDEQFFEVRACDWATAFDFEAWHRDQPDDSTLTIVIQSGDEVPPRYLVVDSGEVLLRGDLWQLPVEAKPAVEEWILERVA